jgi:phosphoribosylanthranilate isomerase
MLIQIYEITSPEEAAAISAMGVDHIGVLVGDGSFLREQSTARAYEIFAGIHSGARRCTLSLLGEVQQIAQIVTALRPDILHLGAAPDRLSPADVKELKLGFPALTIMRSIPVFDESSIAIAQAYDGVADVLLLDSYNPGDRQIGALGVSHSWDLDRRIVQGVRTPVIIAGGLGPENVGAAVAVSHPVGVDSKTCTDKVDGSHAKDLAKVQAFVRAARAVSVLG